MHEVQHKPGKQMLADVRAGFIRRQTSLARWCRDNAVSAAWAHQVLAGKRRGPSARKLRRRIAEAAGLAARAAA